MPLIDACVTVYNWISYIWSLPASRRVSEMQTGTIAMAEAPSRKRLSDTAFDKGRHEMDVDHDEIDLRAPKRLKQEQSLTSVPKSPLATTTNTIVETKTFVDADEAREHMQDVVKEFLDTETQYDRLQRKKTKTKGDLTRITKVKAKLEDLRRQKEELKSRIPMMGSPRKVMKGDSSMSRMFPFFRWFSVFLTRHYSCCPPGTRSSCPE